MLEGTGIDLKTLQTIAGHSDSHTTMTVYVHPQADKLKMAADVIDNEMHIISSKMNAMQAQAA